MYFERIKKQTNLLSFDFFIEIEIVLCSGPPQGIFRVVLLLGSGVKRHVGKKACLFKSRGVKRHVVKSQSVNWHAVFRQSMKKGMFPLGLTRVDNIFS